MMLKQLFDRLVPRFEEWQKQQQCQAFLDMLKTHSERKLVVYATAELRDFIVNWFVTERRYMNTLKLDSGEEGIAFGNICILRHDCVNGWQVDTFRERLYDKEASE